MVHVERAKTEEVNAEEKPQAETAVEEQNTSQPTTENNVTSLDEERKKRKNNAFSFSNFAQRVKRTFSRSR